jgi:4'-phosphopantetheinyl transferase
VTLRRPPEPLPAAGLVDHVVDCCYLDLSTCDAADLATLDDGERERAARFKFDRDRIRYIAAHAQARRHLAARLGIAPAEVALAATCQGKPILAPQPGVQPGAEAGGSGLCFNLTHSGPVGYLAIASFSVGIDVELHRPIQDLQPLIDNYCSAAEIVALAALPVAERHVGFLGVWTRKEAALKAWGTGIGAIPLDELHVGIAPDAALSIQDLLPRRTRDGLAYPALRLCSMTTGPDQVLSIAAAIDGPLTVRMLPAAVCG